MLTRLIVSLLMSAPPACGPAAVPPPVAAAPAPAPAAAAAEPAGDDADDLLARLETAAEKLRDFHADVTYIKWDSVLERRETRRGEVVYAVGDDGSKRFAILLDLRIIGNRAQNLRKDYIFDGAWLAEIDHEEKIFIKRRIVAPGETFDPLRLGEGPFPLPLGQPRDEVVARFDVQRLDGTDDGLLAPHLEGRDVVGLLLVPKPAAPQAEDVERLEVFYDRETLLPVGVSLTEPGGDRKVVRLTDPKRNAGVDEERLNIEVPDAREWRIDVQA